MSMSLHTYELMVKNTSSFMPASPNNYRGALQADTTSVSETPLDTSSFGSFNVLDGYWLGQTWPVEIVSSTSSSGTGFAGTIQTTGTFSTPVVAMQSVESAGSGYVTNDIVVFQNSTADTNDGLIGGGITVQNGFNLGAWPVGESRNAFVVSTIDGQKRNRTNLFEGTVTKNAGTPRYTLNVTKPGFGFDTTTTYYVGIIGSTINSMRFVVNNQQIGSVGTTYSSMQISAVINSGGSASTPIYIWPRSGSAHTDDTSVFELPINRWDLSSIQVVSFQILTNTTTNSVKPEFITIENSSLRTPHEVYGSGNRVLKNVWAQIDSSSVFQKSYGSLSYPVPLQKDFLLRNIAIRLYNADHQPFSLASELNYVDESNPKGFHALVTLKLKSVGQLQN